MKNRIKTRKRLRTRNRMRARVRYRRLRMFPFYRRSRVWAYSNARKRTVRLGRAGSGFLRQAPSPTKPGATHGGVISGVENNK
jgi:hypothetical protein